MSSTLKYDSNIMYGKIKEFATQMGFVAVGCARAEEMIPESTRYERTRREGNFAKMEYMSRNCDKRFNPRVLVPGAESVLVFLAPFSNPEALPSEWPRISEFAYGLDYHKVIKNKLFQVAKLIKDECVKCGIKEQQLVIRVFTGSAPLLERAWAVRAGLGFVGKNNFFISKECGVKNFIGTIVTSLELPYHEEAHTEETLLEHIGQGCGKCTRCIDSCKRGALTPYKLDARKCLSYKTIEEPLGDESGEVEDWDGWIFGCDDCMNACPWNSRNKRGWPEFRIYNSILRKADEKFWMEITEEEFNATFIDSQLHRAGLEKIRQNIKKSMKK